MFSDSQSQQLSKNKIEYILNLDDVFGNMSSSFVCASTICSFAAFSVCLGLSKVKYV